MAADPSTGREASHGAVQALDTGRESSSVSDTICALEQRSNAHICPTFGSKQNLGDSRKGPLTWGNVGAACGN
jgi:hypothetical protein